MKLLFKNAAQLLILLALVVVPLVFAQQANAYACKASGDCGSSSDPGKNSCGSKSTEKRYCPSAGDTCSGSVTYTCDSVCSNSSWTSNWSANGVDSCGGGGTTSSPTPTPPPADRAQILGMVFSADKSCTYDHNYYGSNCGVGACRSGPDYTISYTDDQTTKSSGQNSCNADSNPYYSFDVPGTKAGKTATITITASSTDTKWGLTYWSRSTTNSAGQPCGGYGSESGQFASKGLQNTATMTIYADGDCRWNHVWFYTVPTIRVAGALFDRTTGDRITAGPFPEVTVFNGLGQSKIAQWSGDWYYVDDFISINDWYAVRPDTAAAPATFDPPPYAANNNQSYNYCSNGNGGEIGQTPRTDSSYECQKAQSQDCGERCDFAYELNGPRPNVPDCTNLSGPSRLEPGETGVYQVTADSSNAPVSAVELSVYGADCSDQKRPYSPRAVPGAGTYPFSWTAPTTMGTYTLYGRVWNNQIAECRSACVDGPPRFLCQSAAQCKMTVVVDCSLGAVSAVSTDLNFALDSSGDYQLRTVSWKQDVENPIKTEQFDLTFYPDGASSSFVTVSFARSAVDLGGGNYTATLDSPTIEAIYAKLQAANTNKIVVTVLPVKAGGVACPAATGTKSTTQTVSVKIRETAGGLCSGGAVPNSLTGTLTATWPMGTANSSTDFSVTIPTGNTLDTRYSFTSDTYDCNSCNPSELPIGSSKVCKKSGFNGPLQTTVYVSSKDVTSWWETIGGLAYGRSMASVLPLDSANNPFLCPMAAGSPDPRCAPYLVRSPTFTQDQRAGLALAGALSVRSGWATERPTTDEYATGLPVKHNNALRTEGGYAFNYYLSLISADKRTAMSNTTLKSLSDLPTVASGKPNYFVNSGSLTIDPDATITIGAGEKYILFVQGSLTIGNDTFDPASLAELITVEQGGFLAIFVKGDIEIKPSVGTTMDVTSDPSAADGVGVNDSSTKANITGIFVADGIIVIDSNGLPTETDKRFIGEGSYVSAMAIRMQRSFSRGNSLPFSKLLSGFSPTEVFRHRPDMVLATPAELKQTTTQYQEIR